MLMVARNSRQEAIKSIAATQPVKSAIDPTKTSISELYGENVFNIALMRKVLPKNVCPLQKTIEKGEKLTAPTPSHRQRDEGVGRRQGRHPLHAPVPADDRRHRREARRVHQLHRRRHGDQRVLRQGAHPGRARCLELPLGRPARDLRGARLHRLGSHQPRVDPREHQRQDARHPHRVLRLEGRGARREDPAAAFDRRALQAGGPPPQDPGQGSQPGPLGPSAPSRSTS